MLPLEGLAWAGIRKKTYSRRLRLHLGYGRGLVASKRRGSNTDGGLVQERRHPKMIGRAAACPARPSDPDAAVAPLAPTVTARDRQRAT
jgi:hypothetical protein